MPQPEAGKPISGRFVLKKNLRHHGKGRSAVRPQGARGVRYWTRLRGFDVWQLIGTAGLLIGVLGFSVLIVQIKVLPHTGSGFLLTVLSGTPRPSDEAQPSVAPSPGPSVERPSASPIAQRSGFPSWTGLPGSPSASPGTIVVWTPPPLPTPTAIPSPTDRPGLPKPNPTPTPTRPGLPKPNPSPTPAPTPTP
jgi:hypothetical protein